jgi:hypothetical protein
MSEDQEPDPVREALREAATILEKVREELLALKRDGPNVATRALAREKLLRLDRIIEGMR